MTSSFLIIKKLYFVHNINKFLKFNKNNIINMFKIKIPSILVKFIIIFFKLVLPFFQEIIKKGINLNLKL